MRIYTLNPPFIPHFGRSARWQDTGRGGTLYYPIWLSYAVGVLERAGHEVKLVDAPARGYNLDYILEDVRKYKPELVVVDTSFTSLNSDLEVSKNIKSEIDVPVIMVGPPTSQFAEKILNNGVDIVARYEYEFTLAEIAEKIDKGDSIEDVLGISFKKSGTIIHNESRPWLNSKQLDELPFVSEVYKKHLNIYDYFLNYCFYPMVQIFTGRGCPFQCTFCSWPQTFMGRKYRVRTIKNVLDEFAWIESNLPNVKEVFLEDDTFTISKKRVLDFCKQYRERGLKLTWSCNARVDTLDLKTMKDMKRANCRFLVVGFESADDKILTNIKKGFTVEDAKRFVRNVKKAGLMLHADFIIGLPGETKETIEKTRKFIEEIMPEQLQVTVAAPFPGTKFYEWVENRGYLITHDPNEYLDENGHQKSVISYPWLSAEEIEKAVDDILKDYYLSVKYIPIALKQIFRKNCIDELRRFTRSAKAFSSYVFQRLTAW